MQSHSPEIESTWTSANGWRMHSRAATNDAPDNAPVAVLVHGLVVSSTYMEPLMKELAPDYRVFAPDLPGFGKSEKPWKLLSIPELADALLAWMDSTGIQQPMIIGNSFGCQIVASFAARYPDRIRSIVFVGPTVDPEARNFLLQAAKWLWNATADPPSLGPILIQDYWRAGAVRSIRTMHSFITDRIEDNLARIPVPTLVVRGALDPIVPDRWAKQAAALLPRGSMSVIPGIGHTANYTAPLEIARVARMFDNHPDHILSS